MPPDRGKIFFGVFVFLVLMTFPIWLKVARGTGDQGLPLEASRRPRLVLPAGEKNCVEPAAYMRARHMDLLNEWRDAYVRDAAAGRTWHSKVDGRTHKMSLTGTCLKCHEKAGFCDRCHNYMGESPYCFTCHHASPTTTTTTTIPGTAARGR